MWAYAEVASKTSSGFGSCASSHVTPSAEVASPIAGRITARNAAPGLFVQPGNPPAPFTVADISTMWMLANVTDISHSVYVDPAVREKFKQAMEQDGKVTDTRSNSRGSKNEWI